METIIRKKMLYKSGVEFEDYSMNHIEGCSHGCKYPCYARLIKYKNEDEWLKPKIVSNTLELLDKEIPKLKNEIKEVHLCFTTDLFMYNQPEVIEMSLKIIRKFLENRIHIKTLTKGIIPKELVEIENKFNGNFDLFNNNKIINYYGISLVSLDEDFRKKYEPFTAPYIERIKSLKYLSDNNLYTYVYMEPFSPLITSYEDFKIMLDKIKFIRKIYFGSWQYNAKYKDKSDFKKYMDYISDFCKNNNIELKIKKEIAYL